MNDLRALLAAALASAEGQRFLWDNWRWIGIVFVLAVCTTVLSEE